jgi:DNA-binding transcriptional LysR family regulator
MMRHWTRGSKTPIVMIGISDHPIRWRQMRSEPEVRQLRAFVAVVEHGGFTRAAGALGVSQSTVSEAVQALERVLGADVFVKGRRRPALTPAGEALLPGARRVLASVDEAVRGVADAEAGARATLALGTSESVSAYLLPGVLAGVRREWPGTRIVVRTDACSAIRAGVRERRLDVGLVLGMEDGAGEPESLPIARGRLLVFARPEHPLTRRPADAFDLASATLYLSDAAGDFFCAVARYVEQAGGRADRLQSSGSVEGVKRGVMEDADALGMLPAYAVADDLRAGRFAEVPLRAPLPPIWLRAIWPPATALSPRARAVTDRLREVVLA